MAARRNSFVTLVIVALLTSLSCSVATPARRRQAEENRIRATTLRIGATLEEVRATMGKEPERRDVRKRFDGKTVEIWAYATDYVRRLDTTIVFVEGRVEEIKTLPWYDPD
jgi:hypothetical protein